MTGGGGNYIRQVANLVPDKGGFDNPQRGRVYDITGISPTLNCCQGGGLVTKIVEKSDVRTLTPRESFRLMGVDDADIDKILSCNIAKTHLYELAGNSIVVDVLYHIFRKMFVEKANEEQQLTLF